jgi:hypothetical protein
MHFDFDELKKTINTCDDLADFVERAQFSEEEVAELVRRGILELEKNLRQFCEYQIRVESELGFPAVRPEVAAVTFLNELLGNSPDQIEETARGLCWPPPEDDRVNIHIIKLAAWAYMRDMIASYLKRKKDQVDELREFNLAMKDMLRDLRAEARRKGLSEHGALLAGVLVYDVLKPPPSLIGPVTLSARGHLEGIAAELGCPHSAVLRSPFRGNPDEYS